MLWGWPFHWLGDSVAVDQSSQAPGVNRGRKRGVTKSPKSRRKK